jgi:tetratricopeptide (TPR) repeat protein
VTHKPSALHAERGKLIIMGGVLVALTLLAYWPSFHAGFCLMDDSSLILESHNMRDVAGLKNLWIHPESEDQYYPLTLTVFWVEFQTFGARQPGGYHVVSVVLHIIAALLVWVVLGRLAVPWAWVVAVAFAVHPVHVESVAWISEQKNLLSAIFFLAATYAYLRFALDMRAAKIKWMWYAAAAAAFLMALLCKAITCTFPITMLLLLYWKTGRLNWSDLKPLVPLLVAGLAMAAFFAGFEAHNFDPSMYSAMQLSPVARCLVAAHALWFYAGKLVFPSPVLMIYPLWTINAAQLTPYGYCIAALMVVAALWIFRRQLTVGPLIAVLWFVVTASPALGFVNFYTMSFSYVANHYIYPASVGIIVLVVQGLRMIASWILAAVGRPDAARGPLPMLVCAALLVVVLLPLAQFQVRLFGNEQQLWAHTVENNPDAWAARINLAYTYMAADQWDQAEQQVHASLAIQDNDNSGHATLGTILAHRGDTAGAMDEYRRALQINPNYVFAHRNLAKLLMDARQWPEAISEFTAALQRDPIDPQGWEQLAECYMATSDWPDAIQAAQHSLTLRRDGPTAWLLLAVACQQMHDFDHALMAYREGIALQPGNLQARLQVAAILTGLGRWDDAVAEYQHIEDIDGTFAPAYAGLADVYDRMGNKAAAKMQRDKLYAITTGVTPK